MSVILQKIRAINLELPGVTLTDHSLEIADEDAFRRAGAALAAMDRYSQWWWGDYLLFGEKYDLPTVLDEARSNLHTSTIRSFRETARFFAPKDRFSDLYFNHHASAMYILGEDATVSEARKWLERARAKQWTVGELREAMRSSDRRSEGDPGPMRGIVRVTDFAKVSKFCSTVTASELTADEADELRRITHPLFDFLCQLHRPKFAISKPA